MAAKKPVGAKTRGTTNPNRLRRVDRFITQLDPIKKLSKPLIVDLGFGATPITALELLERVRKVNSQAAVIGIEIDVERVQEAKPMETESLKFLHGGFEIPLSASGFSRKDVDLIRAFNVLRQYDESEVSDAWSLMQSRLSEDGLLVEGTCDEIGRVSSWVTLNKFEPISFTISLHLGYLVKPSKVAERLPKVLIHKNTPGNKIHTLLSAMDREWEKAAGIGSFGADQRFATMANALINEGWPIRSSVKRFKLGEITFDWTAVSLD